MKILLLFTAILLLTTNLRGQNTTVIPNSKEYYLEKSKKQNKTGWFLFGTGIVLSTVGIIGFSNSDFLDSNSETDAYGFMILGGAIAGLSSIPVFIGSANNARRAASLTFNADLFLKQNTLVQNYQPVIGIKIEL
ncbi:hypothetical protein MCEGE10_00940 [Flavobacteriaceae bacterium]